MSSMPYSFLRPNLSASQPNLTDNSPESDGELNSRAYSRWSDTLRIVGQAYHLDDEVRGEEIVGIRKETSTGDNDSPDVRRPDSSLIYLFLRASRRSS